MCRMEGVIRMKKRGVSFLIVVCIILSLFPCNYSSAALKTLNSRAQVITYLRSHMVNRSSKVSFMYTGSDYKALCNNLQGLIYDIGKKDVKTTSDDGDYLLGTIKNISCSYRKVNAEVTYTFAFIYYESKSETKKVNSKITSILKSIGAVGKGKNPYQKVKIIHDYIAKRISYDKTCKNYSAYDGLIGTKTVCNGYAMLTYKMLTEAGIQCKYITGYGYSGGTYQAHAWNLVKLGSKWYNVDVTWDDPDSSNKIYYDYFLKGSTVFDKTHIRDDYYKTSAFLKAYPTSKTNYNSKNASKDLTITVSNLSISLTKKTLKVGKSATLYVKQPVLTSTDDIKSIKFSSKNSKIAKVNRSGKITAVKAGTTEVYTKVTLLNGKSKTFTTTVTVKK